MATGIEFIEYVLEQAGFGARLTHKRMFGEYALYLDDKVVAFACDDSLFLKPTEAGRAVLPSVTAGKPYPEAKDYYVLDEFLDDTDLLRRALQATADALPAPRPKPAKKAKVASAAKAATGKPKPRRPGAK
ncbi:MAG: TfoX/Sxy family protein [Proteobacteria bacterium]|nr:TfoX/Sxy family protein [Pseudomonadota bacterium]